MCKKFLYMIATSLFFFYHWNRKVPNVTPSYFHSIRLENVQQSLVFWTLAVHTKKKIVLQLL